jgi:hypothetical protein
MRKRSKDFTLLFTRSAHDTLDFATSFVDPKKRTTTPLLFFAPYLQSRTEKGIIGS